MCLCLGIILQGTQVSFRSVHRTIKMIKCILIHSIACWRVIGELLLLLTATLSSFHFVHHLWTENGHSFSLGSTSEIKHKMDNFGLESIMEVFYFWGCFVDCFHPGIFQPFQPCHSTFTSTCVLPARLSLALINFEWQGRDMWQSGKGWVLLVEEEFPLGLTLACGLRWAWLSGVCLVSSGQ